MRIAPLYLSTKKGISPSVQHRCGHLFVSDGIPEGIFCGRAPHITASVFRYFLESHFTYSPMLYILAHTVHTRAYCTTRTMIVFNMQTGNICCSMNYQNVILYILAHTVHTRAHCAYSCMLYIPAYCTYSRRDAVPCPGRNRTGFRVLFS